MLSEDAVRALEGLRSMPALFILGALEGTLWLSELVEAREVGRGGDLAVVALMRSDEGSFVDVACAAGCPREAADAVASYVAQEGEAFVVSSRPEVVDEAVRRDGRLYLASQTAFLTMAVDRQGFVEGPRRFPELAVTLLDEHDLEAAEDLLREWDESRARRARDLVMRGNAFGAWACDRLVGIVGTYATTTRWWYLGSLFVHPEYRGRGVGTQLTSEATKEALERAGEAVATVELGNVTSRGLLARLGYRAASVDLVALVQSRA